VLTFRRHDLRPRQTEGTSEQAQELLARCAPVSHNKPIVKGPHQQQQSQQMPSVLQPWRVLRDRSRLGKLWIRVRAHSLLSPQCGPTLPTYV
jgi:hypothetical protein